MNKLTGMCLAAALAVPGLGMSSAFAAPAPYAPAAYQEGYQEGWEAPPAEYQEVERRGFHDGIEGARKDAGNHRSMNVNNREEYRHPDVPHRDRHAYREAFRRGYEVGVQHLMNGGRRDYDHDHDRDDRPR